MPVLAAARERLAPVSCRAYGLRFRIIEREADQPRFERTAATRELVVVCHRRPAPSWPRLDLGSPAERAGLVRFSRHAEDRRLLVRFCDGPDFAFGVHGHRIDCFCTNDRQRAELRDYLTGPVAGIALRLSGRLTLHGSAVRLDGRGIAFAGSSGIGKSTLAAHLIAAGAEGLTDDILAIERRRGRWMVNPGPGRLRLWPDVLAAVGVDESRSALPEADKRWIDADQGEWRFAPSPRSLDAIFFLRSAAGCGVPSVRHLPLRRAAINLVANAYANWLPADRSRGHDLDLAAELVSAVQLLELWVPRRLERLPAVEALVRKTL